ncbi:hypothetical protein HYS00_01640, partial [Candidatus Microgenomates bacterium]|nr:hypothetical protein [Candidatus Microgenomates bacterium]
MADDEVVSEVVSSGPHRGGRVLRTPEERATKQSGESEAQRMQREEERMAQATREQVMEEIKAIIENEQLRVYAEETASRITQKTMQEKAAPDQFRGKENDPKTPLGKATSSKEAAQRILIAAKTGKLQELTTATAGEPPVVNAFAAETIKKISDAVPVTAIGDNSGAFLFDLMNKMLRNEITDFDGLNKAFTNFTILVTADPYVYGRIAEAYKNIGRSYGLDDERLNRMYQTIDELRAHQGSVFEQDKAKDEAKFDYDRQRALANYIGDDEDDNRVIRALYSPQFFLEYVDYIKQIPNGANPEKYGAKFKELSENSPGSDEYWQEVSEILTREIAFRFGKVFRAVSKSHKDKFLDEIANENPMESMNLAKTYLNQALLRLSDRFTDPKVREFYGIDKRRAEGDLRFFSKRKRTFETEKVINYTDVNGNAKSHTVIRDRRISVGRAQEVEIYDFLAGVKFQVERFIDHALPYNHNIQALFLRQAGQDGTFWGQIGQYAAANLTTFDLDSLNDIPDADIVMSAFRMYSKYVKADFAHYDWKNEPGRFTEEFDSPNTPIQQDVVKNLKKLFPELQDHHNKWRLDQAMNIAIGVSRGVFLTEPTTVAWADAPHTGEGNPTFESYYTNSNAALLGLNPQHNPDRWKTPAQTQGPLLHLPVAGEMPGNIRNFMKHWNHVKLYEWMKKRQNSYTQGLPAFTELHPEIKGHHLEPGKISVLFDRMLKKLPGGEARAHKKSHDAHGGGHGDKNETFISKIAKKLPWTETHQNARKEKWAEKGQRRLLTFIDAMPNIGKVGGPIERGSWRNKAYEGWVIYDANGKENAIETFKALENIGVEAVKWWAESEDGKLTKLHRGSGHGDGNFTDEFGEYVYNKYIKPNSDAQLSYQKYVENVKKELVQKQGIKIKQEKADRGGDTTRQTKSQKKAENVEGQYAGVITYRA